MNTLLLFFALPIAVIIISIALQKIFNNPLLVAAIIFAIFLVVTFVNDNTTYLIATIAYTILAYITAVLTNVISRIIKRLNNNSGCCGNSSIFNTAENSAATNGIQLLNSGTNANNTILNGESNGTNTNYNNTLNTNTVTGMNTANPLADNNEYSNSYYSSNSGRPRNFYRCFRGR